MPRDPRRSTSYGTLARMRVAVVIVILLVTLARVAMGDPVRVTIECEGESRTKACPAFLLGFVDAQKVLRSSPRSTADVVVYASTTTVASTDKLRLRFVGTVKGAPPV